MATNFASVLKTGVLFLSCVISYYMALLMPNIPEFSSEVQIDFHKVVPLLSVILGIILVGNTRSCRITNKIGLYSLLLFFVLIFVYYYFYTNYSLWCSSIHRCIISHGAFRDSLIQKSFSDLNNLPDLLAAYHCDPSRIWNVKNLFFQYFILVITYLCIATLVIYWVILAAQALAKIIK